jgi:hypothetical protein
MEYNSPNEKGQRLQNVVQRKKDAPRNYCSQTQEEEAEAIRSQDRERINASRELESQENTAARSGQERESSAARRDVEGQAKTRCSFGTYAFWGEYRSVSVQQP